MNARAKTLAGQPKLTQVSGPNCWKAAELEGRTDWIHPLSEREITDLESAIDALSGRPFDTITRQEFPLPVRGERLAMVRDGVLNGAEVALLRGLPVAGRDEQAISRMLWGVGLHLGQAQPPDAAGALLHHVRDTGVNVAGRDDVRTFETNEAQPWHNDGGDVFALLCRDVATSGGRSYLASTYAVFNALPKRDPELVRTLQADFHFDTRGQALPGRGPVQTAPVFTWHAGKLSMLHKHTTSISHSVSMRYRASATRK
ncbi:MAG: hypothetical protein ACI9DC_002014 [Gammaproteobacteria bacterium]|jgi:hypothetical protein